MVVLTRFDQRPAGTDPRGWVARRWPHLPTATATHAPVDLVAADLSLFHDKLVPAALVSGIGNPDGFRHTARGIGAWDIRGERVFADHHAYTRADVDDLRRWADTLPPDAVILTTQKDMVKLRLTELAGRPVYALRIGIRFLDGGAAVRDALRKAVGEVAVPA